MEKSAGGVRAEVPANLDPSRPAARVRLDAARATVLPGARGLLTDVARAVLAAEAVGVAAETTQQAAEYAKVRQQFGRPIATFQAVKHHCANMLVAAELATAAAWDAGRAGLGGGDQFSYTAAIAAALAVPAAVGNASLNIQVHGGIGFTWEHDAHLYLRRAAAIAAVLDTEQAAIEVTDLVRRGVRRAAAIDLPPEAEPIRAAIRPDVTRLRDLTGEARKQALIETGYAMPHWPKPWGRDATAIEQLVIEQEFAAAGIKRPSLGITGWVILTLIQHASPDQVARWVRPALSQDVIWCQLFSEPGAGSDAAGIRTRATAVKGDGEAAGGWRINGQKVWTSGAHLASFGLATVRTNPDVPKHEGITTMVIDMHAPGVTVRPLKMPNRELRLQRGLLRRRIRARRRRGRTGRRRLDRGARHARQRERQHRRRRRRPDDAGRGVHRAARRAPGAAGRRGWTGGQADSPHTRDGGAESAKRLPCGGRRRPGTGGQHHQAAAVRARP
jgi:alkylation response protein AidB-like acyl-CoA dehydrogenase